MSVDFRSPQFHLPVQIFQDVLTPGLRFDPQAVDVVKLVWEPGSPQARRYVVPNGEAWRVRSVYVKESSPVRQVRVRASSPGFATQTLLDWDVAVTSQSPYRDADLVEGRLDEALLIGNAAGDAYLDVEFYGQAPSSPVLVLAVERFTLPDDTAAMALHDFVVMDGQNRYLDRVRSRYDNGDTTYNGDDWPLIMSANDNAEMALATTRRFDADLYNTVRIRAGNQGDDVAANETHFVVDGSDMPSHSTYTERQVLTGQFSNWTDTNINIAPLTGNLFVRVHAVAGAGVYSEVHLRDIELLT